jgi:hypothetical protein
LKPSSDKEKNLLGVPHHGGNRGCPGGSAVTPVVYWEEVESPVREKMSDIVIIIHYFSISMKEQDVRRLRGVSVETPPDYHILINRNGEVDQVLADERDPPLDTRVK